MISERMLSAEQRIAILNGLPDKHIQLRCVDDILSTLFYADASMPFANAQGAISDALSFYWDTLNRASRIFTPSEWAALAASRSPFSDDRYWGLPAARATELASVEFTGDDWCDEILATKELFPKLAALSETEFAAVVQILRYITGLSCTDPMATMALRLPALAFAPPFP